MTLDAQDIDRIADRLLEKLVTAMPHDHGRLMDIPAAALYMGRTPNAIRHMLKRGTIPGTYIDGKAQLDRVVLDKLIKAGTR